MVIIRILRKKLSSIFNKVILNKYNKRNKVLFNGVSEINEIIIKSENYNKWIYLNYIVEI